MAHPSLPRQMSCLTLRPSAGDKSHTPSHPTSAADDSVSKRREGRPSQRHLSSTQTRHSHGFLMRYVSDGPTCINHGEADNDTTRRGAARSGEATGPIQQPHASHLMNS